MECLSRWCISESPGEIFFQLCLLLPQDSDNFLMLSIIYKHTMIYPFVFQLCLLFFFFFYTILNKLQWTFLLQVFLWTCVFISLPLMPGSGIAKSEGSLLGLLRPCQTSSPRAELFCIPSAAQGSSGCSTSLPALGVGSRLSFTLVGGSSWF